MRSALFILLASLALLTGCGNEHTYLKEKNYQFNIPPAARAVPPRRWQADYYVKNINTFKEVQLPINAIFQDRAAVIYFSWVIGGSDSVLFTSLIARYDTAMVTGSLSKPKSSFVTRAPGNKYLGFRTYRIEGASSYLVTIESNTAEGVKELVDFDYISLATAK